MEDRLIEDRLEEIEETILTHLFSLENKIDKLEIAVQRIEDTFHDEEYFQRPSIASKIKILLEEHWKSITAIIAVLGTGIELVAHWLSK